MKILVCDDISPKGIDVLKSIQGVDVQVKTKQSEADLVKIVAEFDALVVRSATKVTPKILNAAKNLKAIARAGMGFDNIDVAEATRHGIVVMNTPGKNAVTTAEHTIAMLMSLARNIPQANAALVQGKWDRKKYVGTELAGKCLGVVGLGNVGREVAKRSTALNMKVIGYDPFLSEQAAQEIGVKLCTMDELFSSADFISLHAVLNDSTKHLINSETIEKMKPGVRIVNCARGGLIDEDALLKGLEDGRVAGAALDVFADEPVAKDHALSKHPKVVATPHLGASTDEAQEQVAVAAAEQLRTFFVEDVVINGVNVPSVSREAIQALGVYIELAEQLGCFISQLGMDQIDEIEIACSGEITKHGTSPITSAVLVGMMKNQFETPINFVNAPDLARERKIRVRETKSSEAGDYISLIRVSVGSGGTKNTVGGSVFGREHGRIISLNHFYLEVVPKGHLLVIHNEDKPGIVGSWGTVLGSNKINIGQMQVALNQEQQEALSIVNIDTPAPETVLKQLRKIPGIREVRQIALKME